MPGPGSLAVTELPERDSYGRRVAVQRITGSGPVRTGDAFLVLVDVPRPLANGRRMVDVVTAGTVECVTPARGSRRGTWTMHHTGAQAETVENLTRNGAALLMADRIPTAEQAAAIAEADQLRDAIARGDRDAIERVGNARAALAEQLADTEARAERLEQLHAGPEEFAARVEADELRDKLAAMDRHPSRRPAVVEHPADCAACENEEPAGHAYVPAVALHALADAARILDNEAGRILAVQKRHEAATARHAYADARVLELERALEEARQERRESREELAAAVDEHAALFGIE